MRLVSHMHARMCMLFAFTRTSLHLLFRGQAARQHSISDEPDSVRYRVLCQKQSIGVICMPQARFCPTRRKQRQNTQIQDGLRSYI